MALENNMKFKNKQKEAYVNIMSNVLDTKNVKIIQKELKKTNVRVSEKKITYYLNKKIEIENNKTNYSITWNELNNDL